MIGKIVVLFALSAVCLALPVDETRADVAGAALEPQTTLTGVIPVDYTGESENVNEDNRELTRPKRFLLLKKLALAKAGLLGLG